MITYNDTGRQKLTNGTVTAYLELNLTSKPQPAVVGPGNKLTFTNVPVGLYTLYIHLSSFGYTSMTNNTFIVNFAGVDATAI